MAGFNSLSSLVLGLALGLGAFIPKASPAVELSVLTEIVTATQPIEVLVVGRVPGAGPPTGVSSIEIEGDTIYLVLEMYSSSSSAFRLSRLFEVPPLEEPGEYTLALLIADAETGNRRQVASSALPVMGGLEIVVVRDRIDGIDPARLALEGFTTLERQCFDVQDHPILRPSRPVGAFVGTAVVTVEFSCGCLGTCPPLGSPLRKEFDIDLIPFGPWRIDIVDTTGQLVARRTIEILPDQPILHGGQFEIEVDWQDFDGRTGHAGSAVLPTDDSAVVHFFDPDNWELMVKVLDGCAINGHYWVFGAAATNVRFELEVSKWETSESWEYVNPLGEFSPAFADVEAFPCD
ncbi:MAG: hypothetical protein AAGC60_10590 [Acidobacteriota bacterium]